MSDNSAMMRMIAVLRKPAIAREMDEAQWSELVATARSANLLGALAERLKAAGIQADPRADKHLEGARQLSARQHLSVLWEVHQLQKTLGDLNVPVLLLKGAAYVLSAPEVAKGRLFGDIDIMVPRASLADVESQLLLNGWVSAKTSTYDQRYYRQWMHELPPMTHVRRGTVLDVHHTILPLTARHAPDPQQIIARSMPVEQADLSTIRAPCPEDLVIHSITHLVHEGELLNGMRDLADIDCMLRLFQNTPGFSERLAIFAIWNDLAWPVYFGLNLTRTIFGTPIPETLLAALASALQQNLPPQWLQGVFARALQHVRGEPLDRVTSLAVSFVYLRAHALRMPWPLLLRHLGMKAWLGWRRNSDDRERVSNGYI